MSASSTAAWRCANIHYPPEQDRDLEDYYEFFVFDPDGNRVAVACQAPPVPKN